MSNFQPRTGARPRITVVQNDPDVTLDVWEQDFADCGALIDLVKPYQGDPVPALAELADGLVVLGGQMSVNDEDKCPWLSQLRFLFRDAIDADVPVLGVCLGAQLLARATGGSVEVGPPPGREAGVTAVFWRTAAADDVVLGPLAREADRGRTFVTSMHGDAIVDLPAGATWLASSNMYPFQAFRLGSALGVQFHPETSRATLERWAKADRDIDVPTLLAGFDEQAAGLRRVGQLIAAGFLSQVVGHTRPRS